jgi:hypothetical protein
MQYRWRPVQIINDMESTGGDDSNNITARDGEGFTTT